MFYKELDSIRDVEDKADALIVEAQTRGKQMVEAAKQEAETILANSREEAGVIFRKYVEEGKAIAKYNYENQLERSEKEAVNMGITAEKNADEAIALIVERIVNRSVDS